MARAPESVGIPYGLSRLSTRSIEEVRQASAGDLWFQLCMWRDKGLLAEMLDRAASDTRSETVSVARSEDLLTSKGA